MREIDYLMTVSPRGVKLYEDGMAHLNNVSEWLDTPMGSVYGRPEWGNELHNFKHEPHDDGTARMIENSIVKKLPIDVEGTIISEIACNPIGEDMFEVIIVTNNEVLIRTKRI